MEIFKDVEQGSQEWLDMRLGLITCSEIKAIRADGKGAQTYINSLAYERITGESSSVFEGNQWTKRGHELEDVARKEYELKTGLTVDQVAFIKNKGFGYSPDGLVYQDHESMYAAIRGAIEIKSKQPKDQIAILRSGEIPTEHIDQMHGGMLCADLYFMDFVAYCPNLPIFIKRVYRKDCLDQLEKLESLVDKYNQQIDEVVNQISEMY